MGSRMMGESLVVSACLVWGGGPTRGAVGIRVFGGFRFALRSPTFLV